MIRSAVLAGQVDVTWTPDPTNTSGYWRYSTAANWFPNVVPSNGNNGDTYRITIAEASRGPSLDTDASVDALTLTNRGAFAANGHSFTSGVSRLETPSFGVGLSRIDVGGYDAPATANLGQLANFDAATNTLQSGIYYVAASGSGHAALTFKGARILRNAAEVRIVGNGRITDELGTDALQELAINDGVLSVSSFTALRAFTNNGELLVTQSFTALGDLTNNTANNTLLKPRLGQYTPPLTIEGNLTLGSASILQFDIRGTTRPYGLPPNPRGSTLPPVNSYDAINCTGSVVADGIIRLGLGLAFPNTRFAPAPNDTFVVIKSRALISGAFKNAANGERLTNSDGSGSFKVSYGPNSAFDPSAVVLSDFQPNTAADVLLNISSRGLAGSGDHAMIGGFIVTGSQPKRVIIRAIGPSLRDYNVAAPLDDPTLSLHDTTGATLASNDDWIQSSQRTEIERTGIPPNSPRESAIVASLERVMHFDERWS